MKSQTSLRMLIVGLCGVIGANAALGQGVGNLGSLPTQFQSPQPIVGWSVDSGIATNPWVPVQISPTGPQWVKTFTAPNGQPFTAVPGQTFTLQELLVIAPTQSWTDWHEHILTPGWDWVAPTVFMANFATPPGMTTVHTPGTMTTGGALDFYFNPLVPGTLLDIRKTLMYVGQPGVVFTGTLQIAEYPTPEPATLAMLGLGGLAALKRRVRSACA